MEQTTATKLMNQAKEQYLLMAPCKCQWCNGKCIDCQYCGVSTDNVSMDGVSLYPIQAIKESLNEKFGKKIKCICIDCESKCDTTCKYCIHSLDEVPLRLVVIEGSDLPKMRLDDSSCVFDSDSDSEPDSDTEEYTEYLENKRYEEYEEEERIRNKKEEKTKESKIKKHYEITIGEDGSLLYQGDRLPELDIGVMIKFRNFDYPNKKYTDYDDYVRYLYIQTERYGRCSDADYRDGYERYKNFLTDIERIKKYPDNYINCTDKYVKYSDPTNPNNYIKIFEDVQYILDDATTIWWVTQILKEWLIKRCEKISIYHDDVYDIIRPNWDKYDLYRWNGSNKYNIYNYINYQLYYYNDNGGEFEDYSKYKGFISRLKYIVNNISRYPDEVKNLQIIQGIIDEALEIAEYIKEINTEIE